MPIQLIAMDLDGTLLRSDHMTVSERNRNALQHASEKGVHLVLASGRTWVQLESVAQQVPSAQYALLSNGAAARDLHQGKRLFTFDFPWGTFKRSSPFCTVTRLFLKPTALGILTLSAA